MVIELDEHRAEEREALTMRFFTRLLNEMKIILDGL